MFRYLIGDANSGPFSNRQTAASLHAAEARVIADYGPVLDVVDWTDEDGSEVAMFIVRTYPDGVDDLDESSSLHRPSRHP